MGTVPRATLAALGCPGLVWSRAVGPKARISERANTTTSSWVVSEHLRSPEFGISFSSVSTVAEIESAISSLPIQDARRVADWLQEYLDAKWDKELDEDIAAGRLDALWEKAKTDIAAGRVKPLDEVLNHG